MGFDLDYLTGDRTIEVPYQTDKIYRNAVLLSSAKVVSGWGRNNSANPDPSKNVRYAVAVGRDRQKTIFNPS